MATEKMIEAATMPCECTKIAQDETCPVSYPSLLCEMCDGKGHVPYVKLDGPELWEIVFGVNSDAATEITDAQFDQIAKGINDVFVEPLLPQSALLTGAEPVAFNSQGQLDEARKGSTALLYGKRDEFMDIALYAAPPAPSIAVKDLRWDGADARSATGSYRVQRLDDKWEPLHNGYYMLPKMGGVVKAFDTEDEAKAYCQRYHDKEIRSALSAQVQDVATAEPLAWESTTVGYIKYVTNTRYHKFSDAAKKWYRRIPSPIPEGWMLVPKVSTTEMEDAARHLMMWLDFTRPTESSLLAHCKRLGKEPPPECKDVDHVPSKAMRLFWVYRAMLSAAPAAKLED